MSAQTRMVDRYRDYPSAELRHLRGLARNVRAATVIDIVLTERQEAYQRGFDAAQVFLDAVGGRDAALLCARAIDSSIRERTASRFLESEQARGVSDALLDYLQNRSDI